MNSKIRKKKKICIISPYGTALYDKTSNVQFGGAEVQMYLISKELSRSDSYEICVILGDYNLKGGKIRIKNELRLVITYPLEKTFFNHFMRPIKLFLTLIKLKPDIIIQRAATFESGICGFYSRIFKKKFIYSIAHDQEVEKKGIKLFKRLFFKFGLINADFIVTQSKKQNLKLKKLKLKKFFNIFVIKSAYKINDFKKVNKTHILWVGRDVKWKRGELFLELAKKFPNEEFLMICVQSEDPNNWSSLFKNSKKISNLKFLKFIPFNEIDVLFRKAKIFINTSTYEGFPNTFIQALKNKTPVISLNVDPDMILEKNKCGFNCRDKYDELLLTLRRLLDDKKLYNLYSDNALKYVKKNHNIDIIIKHWIKLISFFKKTIV